MSDLTSRSDVEGLPYDAPWDEISWRDEVFPSGIGRTTKALRLVKKNKRAGRRVPMETVGTGPNATERGARIARKGMSIREIETSGYTMISGWTADALPLTPCLFVLPLERSHPSEPTDEQLTSLFESLVAEWLAETALSSSTSAIVTHSAYQRIIGLGPRVVPLILDKVAEGEPHFGWALAAITGENPAKEATSKREAARAWLNWGEQRGYWQGGAVHTVRRGELPSTEGNG